MQDTSLWINWSLNQILIALKFLSTTRIWETQQMNISNHLRGNPFQVLCQKDKIIKNLI